MCSPLESGDLPTVVVNPEASFEPVRDAVLDLRERVEDLCNQELDKITKQGQSKCLFLFPLFLSCSYHCNNHIVCSFPVNDTTLFTLGDGKRNIFLSNTMFDNVVAEFCCLVVSPSCLLQPIKMQGRGQGY